MVRLKYASSTIMLSSESDDVGDVVGGAASAVTLDAAVVAFCCPKAKTASRLRGRRRNLAIFSSVSERT
jgi:hypothetical protein